MNFVLNDFFSYCKNKKKFFFLVSQRKEIKLLSILEIEKKITMPRQTNMLNFPISINETFF